MIIVRCARCAFELRAPGPMSPPVIANPGDPACQHELTHTHDRGADLANVKVYFSHNGRDWTALPAAPAEPPPPDTDLLAPWARYLETIL